MINIKNKEMKKLIIWLAKIFDVNLTVEKIIVKEKIDEKVVEKQVALEGVIDGDITVKGNLIVNGYLQAEGEIACYKIKEEEA